MVTFPSVRQHRSLAGSSLYCLVTDADVCKQLAYFVYHILWFLPGRETAGSRACDLQVVDFDGRPNDCTTRIVATLVATCVVING